MSSPSSAPPRRRFLPQPVETSARSSKRVQLDAPESDSQSRTDATANGESMTSKPKPRKFLPQPIEETTRSSRKNKIEKESDEDPPTQDPSRSMSTQDSTYPGYPTSEPPKSTRRFAPEPVETSARSSRRKFAPEPVETTSRSSKDKSTKEQDTASSRPRRKFAVEPVETSTVRRRRKDTEDESNDSPPESVSESSSKASSRRSTGPRRFSPELIETAKGSYRHKKESEVSSGSLNPRPSSPTPSSSSIASDSDKAPESRFSAAALAKRNHELKRKHSYCVPNLPIIESDSSEDEDPGALTPSLTDSPSSTDNEHHKLNKITEVESYTEYVLSLAQDKERRKLQEQVMAAYINERPYDPPAHFAVEDDDDDLVHVGSLQGNNGADPRTFRRSSDSEHDWEMENMRKHHEQLERAKKELQEDTCGVSRFSAAALAARHHLGQTHKKKDEDAEFSKMKKAASPPMLGEDIIFPYTISPKMTRCDVDQAPRPRRADSDDDAGTVTPTTPELWTANANVTSQADAGLWMGLCKKHSGDSSRPLTPLRSGIHTPAYEASNPFESHTPGRGNRTPRKLGRPLSALQNLPLTPPRTADSQDEFTSSVDKKLQLEKQIEEEFPNRVVTQIYNYLSLGYPSLARSFDEELSKISRISIKELRKDDDHAMGSIRGYVGAPEAETTWEEDEDGAVKGCKRWEALRLYVKEWARQSPNFTITQPLPVLPSPALSHIKSKKVEAWGATVRKGSWAQ